MARLLPPRTLLQFSLAVCLLLPIALLASGQEAAPHPAPVPDPNASANDLEAQGDALRAEKRYLDALDFYKAAMAKQPSALLWNKEGMSYLLLRRNVDATKCFNNAIKLDKHAPEGYNNRGYMEYTKQAYGKAIHDYKKALSLRPTDAVFHYNMASTYFAMHNYKTAAVEYQAAYKLDPNIFERVSKTGVMAQSTSPEDRAAFSFMVAKMYAQAGDIDHSLEYLRKAMEEGYKNIKKVYTDAEFASLREDKRFTELMAQKPQPIQ
ncbi:MAG: TPR end-of-group domain-containing protein [Candidatus Korobacteraceae bacterium]